MARDDDFDNEDEDEIEGKETDGMEDATLLSRKEAARLLKVTERTVIELEKNGYLTPRKKEQGAKAPIFYHGDEVEELKQARKKGGDVGPVEVNDAAMQMAMAPSAMIRSLANSVKIAQDHVKEMMAPVNEMMRMMMTMQIKEHHRLTDRSTKLENEIFEFIDLQKRSMREDNEGKLMEITELENQRMKRETFDRLSGYIPLLATLVGDKLAPSQKVVIRESALIDIIDKMSIEQLETLQKSGTFGQAEMATIITMKQKLENERAERLRKEADSTHVVEAVKSGS